MRIEKQKTVLTPEGCYRVRIENVEIVADDRNGQKHEGLKMIFEVTSLVHHSRTYMARKVYWESDSQELVRQLEELLGDDIGKVISPQGEILAGALTTLINREADIEVRHVHNPKHSTPFCKVPKVTEPGRLVNIAA